jgi:hypothetical protein
MCNLVISYGWLLKIITRRTWGNCTYDFLELLILEIKHVDEAFHVHLRILSIFLSPLEEIYEVEFL